MQPDVNEVVFLFDNPVQRKCITFDFTDGYYSCCKYFLTEATVVYTSLMADTFVGDDTPWGKDTLGTLLGMGVGDTKADFDGSPLLMHLGIK